MNGWWFNSELADSNQATKSTDEQNTEEENLSTKTTKHNGWWFELATTEAASEATEAASMTESTSDGNQAQNNKETERPECNATPVDTKASGFEEFQAAYSRKFAQIYKAKEKAEEAAKEYKEWSDEYDFDSEDDFSEDDSSDSDSAIDDTDPDQLD